MATDLLDLTLSMREENRAKTRFRPVIEKIGDQTKFSRQELEALAIIHYKLTKTRPMDRKQFTRMMFVLFDMYNETLMDSIFSAFDRSNKLVITLDSWLLGMSLFLRGSLDEKIEFCFAVYDLMGNGHLKRDRIFQLMKHSIKTTPDEDPDEVIRDMIDFFLKKMDRDRDGELSFEDYRTSVKENPALLEAFGYCLPSRTAVYAFMTTITRRVTTMHAKTARKVSREKIMNGTSVHSGLERNMLTPSSCSTVASRSVKPTKYSEK